LATQNSLYIFNTWGFEKLGIVGVREWIMVMSWVDDGGI